MCPNMENMVGVPITKRMEIIVSTQVCLISWRNFDYKENSGKKKPFFQNQSINIIDPNVENMIIEPITKKMAIIMLSKFVLFHGWTLIRRKIV